MEGSRFPSVDTRETYVLLTLDGSRDSDGAPLRSRFRKERSVVSRHLSL
jgi:hypothetical protein